MSDKLAIVNVVLEDRTDGGLRVSSPDLRGLILSGPEPDAVARCIIPAIRALLARSGQDDVVVRPAKPINEVLRQPSPRNVDMHVRYEQFVIEFAHAA